MPRSSLLLSAAVLLLVAGCVPSAARDLDPAPQPAGNALSPQCPTVSERPVVSADLVNQVVARADLPGWQAADIGASARLADGRLVWVFGDTVRSAGTEPRIVANSMLLSAGTCITQLVTPDGGPVVPDVTEGEVRWPMSVVVLPPRPELARAGVRDVVVVLCGRTDRGDGGPFDFEFRGTSAAVFVVGDNGVPQLREIVEVTPDSGDLTQVNWGAAATVQDDWFYVYGTRLTGRPGEFGRQLFVARVPVGTPSDRSTWRFWDGRTWQPDQARATPVLGAVGGVSQTLSVDQVDGEWVAVSKRDGDISDFVYTWTAPAPTGPWTPRRALESPAGFDTGELTYAPLAHPEVALTSGRLLVSVSRNTTDLGRLLADPEVGRPLFAEIDRP
ncbi:hypothetical protein DQ237_01745 [Blastococcus sp. TF02-8]|uniref:DUF4185 domain-containing protein n=1 Tax=Blastococcus sp. TF02-8 TaxID=2250574 RepID=UPI000DEB9A4C|nr:DUF4185 domain-containing protein [Blastococcus sp. TF02-8]RBY97675.1 hypothetical protein DQ237_01745 [Blastococcus sp. TF02-8]